MESKNKQTRLGKQTNKQKEKNTSPPKKDTRNRSRPKRHTSLHIQESHKGTNLETINYT